jgi:hypothetical protein
MQFTRAASEAVTLMLVLTLACAAGAWTRPAAPRHPMVSGARAAARPAEAHAGGVAQVRCPAPKEAKNRSVLKVSLQVVNGRLAVDKKASAGGFDPSDLFKCRAALKAGDGKTRAMEAQILKGLDKALRSLPRFYLRALFDVEQEELLTYLPATERGELISLMGLGTEGQRPVELRKKHFLYLPQHLRLSTVRHLSLDQKKEFFAYLPDAEKKKVLEGLPESEQETLRAKKQEDPPPTSPPANEEKRKLVSEFPGAGKKAGSWADFLKVYNKWNQSRPNEQARREGEPRPALKSYFSMFLRGRPIFGIPIQPFSDEDDFTDPDKGQVTLRVADPVGDVNNPDDYDIVVPESIGKVPGAEFITPTRDAVVKLLRPLEGRLWSCRSVEAYINDYFIRNRSGYERAEEARNELQVCLQEMTDEPTLIKIRPVPRVARVAVVGDMEEKEVRTALREVLTDEELKTYRENPAILGECKDEHPAKPAQVDSGAQPSATPDERMLELKCRQIKYEVLAGGPDRLPYLNLINWRLQQAALSDKGFLAALYPYVPPKPAKPKPEGGDEAGGEEGEAAGDDEDDADDTDDEHDRTIIPLYATILLMKSDASDSSLFKDLATGDAKQASGGTDGPAPGGNQTPLPGAGDQPNPGGDGESAETAKKTKEKNFEAAGKEEEKRKKKAEKILEPRKNFIGGEVVYRPGQGIRTYGLYSRKVTGKDDFTIRIGEDAGALASGEYRGEDLFQGAFGREFPFSVEGYTDTTAKRILNAVQLDERRTGGVFHVGTELKRTPTHLSLFFEARRETVQLERGDVVTAKQNLTTLRVGGLYGGTTKGVHNVTWLIEPTLRFGVDGQPHFAVLNLTGLAHLFLRDNRDLIFDGRLDVASSQTPLFEQPSFGGEETVRGFRADDAIGLRQWAFKTEFRLPTPGSKPDSKGLAEFFRQNVKLAAFLDVGGIYRTTGSEPGVRFGPGGGVRLNYRGADLGLSWAYGLGDAAAGRGRGRFYFSVSRELPRLIRR